MDAAYFKLGSGKVDKISTDAKGIHTRFTTVLSFGVGVLSTRFLLHSESLGLYVGVSHNCGFCYEGDREYCGRRKTVLERVGKGKGCLDPSESDLTHAIYPRGSDLRYLVIWNHGNFDSCQWERTPDKIQL